MGEDGGENSFRKEEGGFSLMGIGMDSSFMLIKTS